MCVALKITPHQYLIVKEVMVRESARAGMLKKKDARTLVGLDPSKVSKVFDFLHACGWVQSGASSGAAARGAVAGGVSARDKR